MAKSVLELVSLRSEPIPPQTGSWRVNLSDPARTVMTDFNEHNIVAVAPKQQVDEALEAMRHAGVRSAFVLNESRSAVLGLITAYDIMGEKPLRHIQMVGGVREDVMVADIMDRAPEWQVLRVSDVDGATVEMVLATFQKSGRTHLPVVSEEPSGSVRLRGVFSAAKLLRLTEASRRAKQANDKR